MAGDRTPKLLQAVTLEADELHLRPIVFRPTQPLTKHSPMSDIWEGASASSSSSNAGSSSTALGWEPEFLTRTGVRTEVRRADDPHKTGNLELQKQCFAPNGRFGQLAFEF